MTTAKKTVIAIRHVHFEDLGGFVTPIENAGYEIRYLEAGRESVVAPLGEDGGQMLHWHGDTFDLPEGAQLLASTDDYTNQIYAIGKHVLAFQCHPELNPHAFEHWLVGHAFEIAKTPGVNPVGLREDTAKYGSGLQRRGRRTIENWLRGLRG